MRNCLLVLAVMLAGCTPDQGETREWRPGDHDRGNTPAAQVMQTAAPEEGDNRELVELAWKKNCNRCHGPGGKGDGPQGQMFNPPDLTSPAVAAVGDDELLGVIKNGKNRMPPFTSLPDAVIEGLLIRIRANGPQQ